MTDENRLILLTKDSSEYKCWIKEAYKEKPEGNECKDYEELDFTTPAQYKALFEKNDSYTTIKGEGLGIIICDGSKVNSAEEVIPISEDCKDGTIFAIHFGEGEGLEKFPEEWSKELDKAIRSNKLEIYFAHSLGKDIPTGVNPIFNKIAKKDISADEVIRCYKDLFDIFVKEARKKKHEDRINQIANFQLLLSSYLLLDGIENKSEKVNSKVEEIRKQIKETFSNFVEQGIIPQREIASFTTEICKELNQKLNDEKNKLIDEYTDLLEKSA